MARAVKTKIKPPSMKLWALWDGHRYRCFSGEATPVPYGVKYEAQSERCDGERVVRVTLTPTSPEG